MLMVQSNTSSVPKPAKLKCPPPVPPRPNQSVVAEALAKTRKAVAESKVNLIKSRNVKPETQIKTSKAKTLDRTGSIAAPKQNGLARVKSFIRDVISDRSSSSDEKKSSGTNSRRSSSDSSSTPLSINPKKSNESLNTRAVKTCKQILVRSLSASTKVDSEKKSKVSKSSSFAEKTLPLRKAPPPPLSPKPKLRPLKPLSISKPIERNKLSIKRSPELSLYSSPVDAKRPPPLVEAPYATVEEVQVKEDRLHETLDEKAPISISPVMTLNEEELRTSSLERKTSRVTERLISEIMASKNQTDENTVIDKGKDSTESSIRDGSPEIRKDLNNHEMLIYELQTMGSLSNVPDNLDSLTTADRLQQCDSPSSEECPSTPSSSQEHNDYADPYSCIIDDGLKSRLRKQFRAISTMSLHGLPPLPKSLSGFADDMEVGQGPSSPTTSNAEDVKPTDLDSQLDYLKREMASLRQLDLSLLSELWSLSEAMSSWRRQLDRGLRLRPAPPPPLPPHYLRT